MKTKTADNRKCARQTCTVLVDGKEGTVFDNIQTIDISRGGIGFIAPQVVPIKEQIAIEIELTPDEDPVLVMGQVQWVRKLAESENYRIGMKFTDILAADSRARLRSCFPN